MDPMKQGASFQESSSCVQISPLPITFKEVNGEKYFDTGFAMYVANEEEQGLYNLFFHNCPSYNEKVAVNFSVSF